MKKFAFALAFTTLAFPALADGGGNNGNGGGNSSSFSESGSNFSLGAGFGGAVGSSFSLGDGSAWANGAAAQGAGYTTSGATAFAGGNGTFAALDCGCGAINGDGFAGVNASSQSFAGGLVTGVGSAGGTTSGSSGGFAVGGGGGLGMSGFTSSGMQN
jgi:hypothetical protein